MIQDIIKYLQKCEGCTHFCEILYLYFGLDIQKICLTNVILFYKDSYFSIISYRLKKMC